MGTALGYAVYALVATAASMVVQNQMSTAMPAPTEAPPIDKSQLQEEGKIGELKLGEEADKKQKRKKGKLAFKIAREEERATTEVKPVAAPEAKTAGVQL